jgi:hypothetical protein
LEKSIELYGGPDIVVNNAGTCYSNQVGRHSGDSPRCHSDTELF